MTRSSSLHKKRLISGSLIGNLLEHYDTTLYSLLVPFIAPLFFPAGDRIVAMIMGYAVTPLSMLAKPIGALFFGRFGDRLGKRRALILSLMGMAATTACMGLLPSFQSVGYLAPCLLILARASQHFFAAGEATGGALLLLEQVKRERRSFASSIFDSSTVCGALLASAVVGLLAHLDLIEKLWRILFFLGSSTAMIGLILRSNLSELDIPESKRECLPTWKVLWQLKGPLCAIMLVTGFSYATYQMPFTMMNSYLPLVTKLDVKGAVSCHTLFLLVDLLLLPVFGYLAMRASKERLMRSSALLMALIIVPLFLLLPGAGWSRVIWIVGLPVLLGVAFAAPYHHWVQDRVPEEHRYTVISVGRALGGQLIGAPEAAIGLWLYKQTGWVAAPAFYLVVTGIIAAITLSMRPSHRPAQVPASA